MLLNSIRSPFSYTGAPPLLLKGADSLQQWLDFIVEVHYVVTQRAGEPPYITVDTIARLESLITTALVHYSTDCEKVVSLYFYIIKSHPFLNANKRTAVAVLLYFKEYLPSKVLNNSSRIKDITLHIARGKLRLFEVMSILCGGRG